MVTPDVSIPVPALPGLGGAAVPAGSRLTGTGSLTGSTSLALPVVLVAVPVAVGARRTDSERPMPPSQAASHWHYERPPALRARGAFKLSIQVYRDSENTETT